MMATDPMTYLEPLAAPIGAATIRGAIILLAANAATQLLRRHSAATRHAIWSGAIAAQLLVLALGIWGPHWRVATPRVVADVVSPVIAIPNADIAPRNATASRDSASSVVLDVKATRNVGADVRAPVAPASVASPDVGPATPPLLTGRNLLLLIWLGGVLFVALRLVVGTVVVATLARRGARVDDGHWLSLAQKLATSLGIDRPLILMRGSAVAVPITWGIVYPIVLLPADADAWTEERRRFVLVHEMAHVKRFDALTQLVGQIVLAIFWFNPLVWIANRRMQLEREHACDDYVLRHGTAPSQYAEELLEMVRSLGRPGLANAQPAFAALAMARRSEFEGRMLSILDPVLDRHPLSRGRTMIGILASVLVVIPLAALQPYRANTQGTTRASAQGTAPADVEHLPESFKITFHDAPEENPAVALGDTSTRTSSSSTTKSASSGATRDMTDALDPAEASAAIASPAISADAHALAPAMKALAAGHAALSENVSTLVKQSTGRPSCATARLDGSTTGSRTHIHSDDDESMDVVDFVSLTGSRCTQANIVGKLTYTPDETDVVDMPLSGRAAFRERTVNDYRELTLTRTSSGIVRSYRHNGADAPYDDDARRWFARFLPSVLRESAINVSPRVARWREQGGVSRVLEEIGGMASSGAKRAHYHALFEQGHLATDDVDRIVKQASRDLRASSGDMRSILSKAAPVLRQQSGSARMLGEAFASIQSSGDRTAVLQAYGATDNRDMLLVVMRAAKTIPSSGDLSRLLVELVPRYLGGTDAELRDAYFDAANSVPSSGDLRNVLSIATGYASRSEAHTRAILESVRTIASSGDRASVLIRLADAGGLRTPALRELFMSVTSEIPSSGDMRRVMEAASRQ